MKLTQPLEFSIAQFLLLNFQSSLLCRMFMALLLKLGRPFDPNWAWQNLNNTIIIYGPQRPQGCICGPLRSRGYTPLGCMARKGPKVGIGMLDFVEDIFVGVKSH